MEEMLQEMIGVDEQAPIASVFPEGDRIVVAEPVKLKSVTVRIDAELHEQFKVLAKNRSTSMSKVLYRAVLKFIKDSAS